MNKTDKLTKDFFETNNILIRNDKADKDIFYYKDLVYGVKRVLNLDVISDREKDKRIILRLTPQIEVTCRERHEVYSTFAYDFYELYKLAKAKINDKSPNKNTKELRKVFIKKITNNKNSKPCFITIK